MPQINLRVSDELLAEIERARGREPRESWLRAVVTAHLKRPAKLDGDALLERGRVLANQRDALIAQGVPAEELVVPMAPVTDCVPDLPERIEQTHVFEPISEYDRRCKHCGLRLRNHP